MNKRFLFVSLKGRNGSYIFLMSAKGMRLFNIFFFVPSKKKKDDRGDFEFPPGASSESKLTKRSLAERGFLFYRFVPPLAMQTAGWVCIAETASVFLDLSRVAWKSNANPHCVTDFICSTDLLQ